MLIHAVVLIGVAVVSPLALGEPRRWVVASLAVALCLAMPLGAGAAAVAAVWLVVAVFALVSTVRSSGVGRVPSIEVVSDLGASAFAVVAAGAFVASRAGIELFGIGEPIVELTAVHFTYAGVGAVVLAGAAAGQRPRLGAAAVALTLVAPPLVASGFLLGHPLPQVGGALLMSAGVLSTASLQLCEAIATSTPRRPLLVVSGLAPWIPMALAVAWASSLHWDVPALSIPDMARTHGVANVVFVVAGLLARSARSAPVLPAGPSPSTPASAGTR